MRRTSRISIGLGRDRWIIAVERTRPVPRRVPQAIPGASQLRYNPDSESGSNLTWQIGRRPSATHARHWMDGWTRRRRRTRDAAPPGRWLVPRDVAVGVDPREAAGGERDPLPAGGGRAIALASGRCRRDPAGVRRRPLELRIWAEGDRAVTVHRLGTDLTGGDRPGRRPGGLVAGRAVARVVVARRLHRGAGVRLRRLRAGTSRLGATPRVDSISRLRASPTASRTPSAGRGTARRRRPRARARRRPTTSPVASSSSATTGLIAVCQTTACEPYRAS